MPGVFGTTQTARTGINPALQQRNIQTARAPGRTFGSPPARGYNPPPMRVDTGFNRGPIRASIGTQLRQLQRPGPALGQLAARIAMMQGRR